MAFYQQIKDSNNGGGFTNYDNRHQKE